MTQDEACWLTLNYMFPRDASGRFHIYDKCGNSMTDKTFKTRRTAFSFCYMCSPFGERDRAERNRWWKARPSFHKAVADLIHETATAKNACKLDMIDVFHKTQSLAERLHITGYKLGYWQIEKDEEEG